MYSLIEKQNKAMQKELERELRVSLSSSFRPVVAITANYQDETSMLARAYSDAVQKAGAIPIILPVTKDTNTLFDFLRNEVDGLILSGGDDIYPMYMDDEPRPNLGKVSIDRDEYELKVIHIAEQLNIPILGICRGMQILGVYYSAKMYQDIPSEYSAENLINHNPPIDKTQKCHSIEWADGENRLRDRLQGKSNAKYFVNSIHHQGLKEVSYPFRVVAKSPDGIIEAIDAYPEKDILAVQWHPEQLVKGGDYSSFSLFEHIVERARLYKLARGFHRKHLSIDSHTDTPMFLKDDSNLFAMDNTLVDISRMAIGDISASMMVAYLPQGDLNEEEHKKAFEYADNKLDQIYKSIEQIQNLVSITSNPDTLENNHKKSIKTIIPAIENGYAIAENLANIEYFKRKYDIAYITLCHNGDNLICDSARKSNNTHNGLSSFGKAVVKEMERLGIMVDISHTSQKTVNDVLDIATKPIIASHSSVYSICQHDRNLRDDEIKRIAESGGVVQICLYAGFINNEEKEASLIDAVNHIDYIKNLVGIDYVGIGSDFDGDGELIGLRDVRDLIRISIELLDRDYTMSDLSKLWGKNMLRVMSSVSVD